MRVKEILKEKGLTAKELASRLGLSEGALSQSVNGNPTLERLTEIADALGVSIAELFVPVSDDACACPHCGKSVVIKTTLERGE